MLIIQPRPSQPDFGKIIPFADDLSEAIGWVLIPGKYTFDKYVVGSEFNKKHKLFAYDPRDGLFSPLDFTPVGAISKGYKGYRAISRGKQLTSMGFSGFGRKKVKEGAVQIFTSIASKLVGTYRPGTTGKSTRMSPVSPVYDQSRVGPSLTSKPKTRGIPLSNVSGKRYHLGRTRNWAKGHNPCASGYKLERRSGIYYCVKK